MGGNLPAWLAVIIGAGALGAALWAMGEIGKCLDGFVDAYEEVENDAEGR